MTHLMLFITNMHETHFKWTNQHYEMPDDKEDTKATMESYSFGPKASGLELYSNKSFIYLFIS